MNNLELNVSGMVCHGCENRLQNALLNLKEVSKVEANHETGKVLITLKNTLTPEVKNQIIATIENLDFEVMK